MQEKNIINKKILIDNLKIIKNYLNEGIFKFTESGLNLIHMDPCNVALIDFKIKESEFIGFNMDDINKMFSVNLNELYQNLLFFDDTNIEFYFNNESLFINDSETNIKIPLLEIEDENQKIPELEFKTSFKINSKDFFKNLNKLKGIEKIKFISESGNFKFNAVNNLTDFNFKLKNQVNLFNHEDSKTKYSLEYLLKFKDIVKIQKDIIIKFGDEYPLMIETNNIIFLLAPRVQN